MEKKIALNLCNTIISIVFFFILLLFMNSSIVFGEEMWNMNESDGFSITENTIFEPESETNVINNIQSIALLAASNPYFYWDNWQRYGTFVSNNNESSAIYYQSINQPPYNWLSGRYMYFTASTFGDTKPYFYAGAAGAKIQNYPRPTNNGITEYSISTKNSANLKFYTSDEPGDNPTLLPDVVPNNFVRANNIQWYVTSSKQDYILGSGVLSGRPFTGQQASDGLLYLLDSPETVSFNFMVKFTSYATDGGLNENRYKRQVWDTGFREPHVFKVFHKDIDTGLDISTPQILGKDARIYDKVVASKLNIPGYTYVKGQYYELDAIDLTQTEKSISSSPYESVIDMDKKAIVYLYKKGTLDLTLTKKVDATEAKIGDTVNYEINPRNSSDVELIKPVITDTLPNGMGNPSNVKFNGGSLSEGKANANVNGDYYTWNENSRQLTVYFFQSGSLTKSTYPYITYSSEVLKGSHGEEKINTAVLSGENDGGLNPKAQAKFKIVEDIDLTLTKKVDVTEAKIGDTVNYEINPRNPSGIDLIKPVITDTLPSGMGNPSNVKFNGGSLDEGKANANVNGDYYTWEESSRKLTVYFFQSGSLTKSTYPYITYSSEVLKGSHGEEKINTAVLSGENDGGLNPKAQAKFKIISVFLLHVKQEVVNPNNEIVVPSFGYINLSNITDIKEDYSMRIPSYLVDSLKEFKTVKLQMSENHYRYIVKDRIPEFYKYLGFQLTSKDKDHFVINIDYDLLILLDYGNSNEYWLTIYIEPETSSDGPPFYNWDYKTNSFGEISVQ